MTTTSLTVNTTLFVKMALVVATLSLMILPIFANAASYAYVNSSGEVRVVSAGDPNTAIMTAPSRAVRSGVLLLISASDSIVGDNVSGM